MNWGPEAEVGMAAWSGHNLPSLYHVLHSVFCFHITSGGAPFVPGNGLPFIISKGLSLWEAAWKWVKAMGKSFSHGSWDSRHSLTSVLFKVCLACSVLPEDFQAACGLHFFFF